MKRLGAAKHSRAKVNKAKKRSLRFNIDVMVLRLPSREALKYKMPYRAEACVLKGNREGVGKCGGWKQGRTPSLASAAALNALSAKIRRG